MTTKDFIRNTYGVQSNKERKCSSVFTDMNGNVYSYGYHYPLLFQVGGLWFVNKRGYSNTTSKHIGYAYSATDYHAIGVELNSGERLENITIETILKRLEQEHNRIAFKMDNKLRKNTAIFASLDFQLTDVDYRIDQVKAVLSHEN